jgi:hypothetical protein
MMKTRCQNEFDIQQLYGTDGPIAVELIARVVYEFGLSAFTDETVNRLAELHRAREEEEISHALNQRK